MILERFKVSAKDQALVSETALRRTVTQISEKLGPSAEMPATASGVRGELPARPIAPGSSPLRILHARQGQRVERR